MIPSRTYPQIVLRLIFKIFSMSTAVRKSAETPWILAGLWSIATPLVGFILNLHWFLLSVLYGLSRLGQNRAGLGTSRRSPDVFKNALGTRERERLARGEEQHAPEAVGCKFGKR